MARSRSVLGIFRAVSKPWRIERFRKIQAGRNAGDLSFGKRADPGAGRNRETGAALEFPVFALFRVAAVRWNGTAMW